jgi:selenocysteine lyase/cysteine desulfurase
VDSYKAHFSRFFAANPQRLHAAAHSHHLWPDVTYNAQIAAWEDAARLADRKWERIFGELLPELRGRIAETLGLPTPSALAFAPNTHELVVRLRSCLPTPAKILTTDAEFHSFSRQLMRWQEAGTVAVDRIPAEPFATFPDRFLAAVRSGGHDLIYLSHVFFNSGYTVPAETLGLIANAESLVAIDGYHAFMAQPVDLSAIADRVFYLSGGYKYAMSGEGVCFMSCPPGVAPRPVNTGWFAGFGDLEAETLGVAYAADGMRFAGSTVDPTGFYRMNAVLGWLADLGVTVVDIHRRVRALQSQFLDVAPIARLGELVPGPDAAERGHFLTFRSPRAGDIYRALLADDVVTDYRNDRLRFGFGLYHDPDDIDELARRIAAL